MDVTHAVHGNIHTLGPNVTFEDGCSESEVIFIDMHHLPSDDHHNIVSSEVEIIARKIKDCLVSFLFLIGGPANVINMAVFWKQGVKDRVNLCLFVLSLTDELHLIMGMIHHGEQLHLQFTTKEKFGPIDTFLTNNNLLGLMGFNFISYILSAIIATERCLCVLNPLKFQTLLRTRTMAAIILLVYSLVLSLYFIMAFRYRIGCVYDPSSEAVTKTGVTGEFYERHQELIDNLESFVFGVGLPGFVMVVVVTTTRLTVVKLRQIVTWRAETSSSISPREVALTKMLVGTSILFMACIFPVALIRFSWLFLPGMNSGHQNLSFFLTSLWITELFTFINASLNIFVYYAMGSRYRETFWALFGRKSRQKDDQPSQTFTTSESKQAA
ncbi:uncharacterized protein LOC143296439 [Babylonia areolata]|uniref:uncharacterized protein LOC143296439 n=1 Tax=Babylonia areolata TaxID=304850 RepID=UPI003FD2C485